MKSGKSSNSNQRILSLLNELNISQTEFCKKTGITKSALSNYLNGDREPRQDQLIKIADAYDLNPAWLMGYDVSKYDEQLLKDYESFRTSKNMSIYQALGYEVYKLANTYEQLPQEGKDQMLDYTDFLLQKYSLSVSSEELIEAQWLDDSGYFKDVKEALEYAKTKNIVVNIISDSEGIRFTFEDPKPLRKNSPHINHKRIKHKQKED